MSRKSAGSTRGRLSRHRGRRMNSVLVLYACKRVLARTTVSWAMATERLLQVAVNHWPLMLYEGRERADARRGGRRPEASLMTAATAAGRASSAGLTAPMLAVAWPCWRRWRTPRTPSEMPAASDAPGDAGRPHRRRRQPACASSPTCRRRSTPTVFTLADPDRIVVDLPEVRFALPRTGRQPPAAG